MKKRIQELVEILNKASKEYYSNNTEIISNFEYDKLYDELVKLEEASGIIMAKSPTQNVGYESVDYLEKIAHDVPMLSLNKTKSVEELQAWLGEKQAVLSWKIDGLTVVMTYEDGELKRAVTRGNGLIGEVVTTNARTFNNLPLQIPFKGKLTVRGEAFIGYEAFQKINNKITDESAKYKNPRNLCSGSVRQLDSNIASRRQISFNAFFVEGQQFASVMDSFEFLEEQGFSVVEHFLVNSNNVSEKIEQLRVAVGDNDIPSDGLVLMFDDIAYGKSLGNTAKYPRNAIAFKWQDEIQQTKLVEIEWSASRTGLINPIAVFEPVELEGTVVSRASLHNVSVMQNLELGLGDTIGVYKANMIIPQISENFTKSNNVEIPRTCPACDRETKLKDQDGIKTLHCENKECPAKHIKAFTLLVSRDALNIENISEATLEKFVDRGYVKTFADIYNLKKHKDEIINMDGFGQKSYDNIISAVENSRKTTLSRIIYALGIEGVGVVNARNIAKHCNDSWDRFISINKEDLLSVDGIGDVLSQAIVGYLDDLDKLSIANSLVAELTIEETKIIENDLLGGKTFVVTGSIAKFKNRKELQQVILDNGGNVSSSISKNTTYLINNDILSQSSKNKKAKELGIDIISEDDFLAMLQR
ncbi:MAG: NAD-dependent DNA ligase LigA [Eubacteriales bacterium]|nr:NAD-dependent DNA ligase LigA [Eubacteriales bacterium]MDY3332180.1 NAD-dependent DNA ligase LigA [Gallibacter sp.]